LVDEPPDRRVYCDKTMLFQAVFGAEGSQAGRSTLLDLCAFVDGFVLFDQIQYDPWCEIDLPAEFDGIVVPAPVDDDLKVLVESLFKEIIYASGEDVERAATRYWTGLSGDSEIWVELDRTDHAIDSAATAADFWDAAARADSNAPLAILSSNECAFQSVRALLGCVTARQLDSHFLPTSDRGGLLVHLSCEHLVTEWLRAEVGAAPSHVPSLFSAVARRAVDDDVSLWQAALRLREQFHDARARARLEGRLEPTTTERIVRWLDPQGSIDLTVPFVPLSLKLGRKLNVGRGLVQHFDASQSLDEAIRDRYRWWRRAIGKGDALIDAGAEETIEVARRLASFMAPTARDS
jgi:hypothetical protein